MKKNGGGILEVITFSTTTHQHFSAFLQFVTQQLNFLRVNQFEYELIPKTSQQICLVCHKWPKYLSRSEVIDAFRHYFSVGVAEFIVQELEPILVRNMLIKDYHYTGEKLDSIFDYCQQLLYLDEESSTNVRQNIEERKCKIYTQAYACLAEERVFDLIGFVQFRLQNYLQDLKALQEFAIHELLIVEEYQEFVRLLRSYISIQEPKISLLHVLHIEGHHFLIYNENKEEITEDEIEAYLQAWAGHKIIYEGMMVSTLISMAPQTIVVHTENTELNVITTLKNIFQDRLHICKSCTDCTKWKEKEYKRFKKTPTNT